MPIARLRHAQSIELFAACESFVPFLGYIQDMKVANTVPLAGDNEEGDATGSFHGGRTGLLPCVANVLFPRRCVMCGSSVLLRSVCNAPLCCDCERTLYTITAPICERCGMALVSESHVCMRCRTQHYHFESNRAIFEYDDRIKRLLHAYKFSNQREVGRYFGFLLYRRWKECYPDLPVVPAPANPRSVRRRGWDQTRNLIHTMRAYGDVPYALLLRRRPSASQKHLDREQRASNLHNVLSVRAGAVVPRRVVLLDDVFTTGATLDRCAAVLRRHGAQEIFGLTLAID